MRRLTAVVVSMVAVLCLAHPASAAGGRGGKDRQEQTAAWYSVIQVVQADRTVTYEVIDSAKVASRRTELMKTYQTAMREWGREAAAFRTDAASVGKQFSKPRPAMPTLTVAKQFKKKEDAEQFARDQAARHSVVRIRGSDGKTVYEAVQTTQLVARKTQLDQEYAETLRTYEEEKAAFRKDNPTGTFDRKRPQRPSLIVMQDGLKDQATAQAVVSRMQGRN